MPASQDPSPTPAGIISFQSHLAPMEMGRLTLERLANSIGIGECPPIDWHTNDQFTRVDAFGGIKLD
jgi:hypothetical protein